MKIGIVNYSLGNVGSVLSAFAFNNYDAYFVLSAQDLSKADFIVMAGVGNYFFYFMHSYHFTPEEDGVVAATTRYGNVEIVSAVEKENIIGVQFHPEKSQGDGLRLLENCLEMLT